MTDPEIIKSLDSRALRKFYDVDSVEEALANDDKKELCSRCASVVKSDQWYRVEFSNIDRTEKERYYLCLACKTIFQISWIHEERERWGSGEVVEGG
jgi:hypothetical protein